MDLKILTSLLEYPITHTLSGLMEFAWCIVCDSCVKPLNDCHCRHYIIPNMQLVLSNIGTLNKHVLLMPG